jgi:type II secretory pathway pseudopilin PulG
MKKLFAILLIIFGSFLEIWYYKFRFENDGIESWLAITIGIALTLFLALAVLKNKKSLIIALIIYSILATSAGQSFSLSKYENVISKQDAYEKNYQDNITELENRIKRLDNEYDKIQSDINNSVSNLEDRHNWRRIIREANARLDTIESERTKLQAELSRLRSTATTHETIEKKSTNVYLFYNNLTGSIIGSDWWQFIFQTILSLFIALMAPLGIIIIIAHKKRLPKKITKTIKDDDYWRPWVERWVHASWIGKRTGKSDKILPADAFFEFTSTRGKPFTKTMYNLILNVAKEKKLLDTTVIKYYNELEAINIIVGGLIENEKKQGGHHVKDLRRQKRNRQGKESPGRK